MTKLYYGCVRAVGIALTFIFGIFTLLALFVKSVYLFSDMPSFSFPNGFDIAAFAVTVVAVCAAFRYRKLLNRILTKTVCAALFFSASLALILLVPLSAFSDMLQVFNGSAAVARLDFSFFSGNSYFELYPNNVVICFVYGIFFSVLPDSVIVLKAVNIVAVFLITFLAEKILQILCPNRYGNLFYAFSLFSLPLTLYSNHIYTDIPFTLLTTLSIWLYFKNRRLIAAAMPILAFSCLIRPQGVFYMIALVLHYAFVCLTKDRKGVFKRLLRLSAGLLSAAVVFGGYYALLKPAVLGRGISGMPPWSYIYMGFNEEEFGFQDGSHSTDRSLGDVAERLEGYDAGTLASIVAKKTFWTWTEGTYQASRYAFGEDAVAANEKFAYTDPASDRLTLSQQPARRALDALMRAQYLICFAAMLPALFRRREDCSTVFILLFAAYFAFYVFSEIKSRYVLPLYPFMQILAFGTLLRLPQRLRLCGRGRKVAC